MTKLPPKSVKPGGTRRPNVGVRQLRYFIAVAEEGSFRKASEILNISQPPLGRQIRQLETELGTDLFVRNRTGVTLTEAGTELLAHAYRIDESFNLLAERVALVSTGAVGSLSVALADEFAYGDLAETISEFQGAYRDVSISTRMATSPEIVDDVCSGRCDIGFVILPLPATANDLEVVLLKPMPLVVAVNQSHPLAHQKAAYLREFQDDTFVCGTITSLTPFYLQTLTLLKQANITPRLLTDLMPMEFKLDLVAANLGVAFSVEQRRRAPHPSLRYISLLDEGATLGCAMIWSHNSAQRRCVQLFLKTAESLA